MRENQLRMSLTVTQHRFVTVMGIQLAAAFLVMAGALSLIDGRITSEWVIPCLIISAASIFIVRELGCEDDPGAEGWSWRTALAVGTGVVWGSIAVGVGIIAVFVR